MVNIYNRNSFDTVFSLLNTLLDNGSDGMVKDHLFKKTGINFQKGNELLDILYVNKLITTNEGSHRERNAKYNITEAGYVFISLYSQIREMIKT